MAVRGVPQLQRLVLQTCDLGGSSAGLRSAHSLPHWLASSLSGLPRLTESSSNGTNALREFLQTRLEPLREQMPSVEVVPLVRRSKEPLLRAHYRAQNRLVSFSPRARLSLIRCNLLPSLQATVTSSR